jgi:hypothetical protein
MFRRRIRLAAIWSALLVTQCGQPEEGLFANVTLAQPALADNIRSMVFYVFSNQLTPQGTLVCSQLLDQSLDFTSTTIEVLAQATYATPPDVQDARTQTLDKVPAGNNRIAYVEAFPQPSGAGAMMANGCAEGIEIVAGQKSSVDIQLQVYTK